jgi:hypothetical protein
MCCTAVRWPAGAGFYAVAVTQIVGTKVTAQPQTITFIDLRCRCCRFLKVKHSPEADKQLLVLWFFREYLSISRFSTFPGRTALSRLNIESV